MSNGQFRAPWRNRSKPAPPERTLSDFRRPADQITLSKIAIFGGGRLFAIQNTSHLDMSKQAAEHLEQAAKHHLEAAKHHVEGVFEKAAHEAHLAHAHHVQALEHAEHAAKEHLKAHGKK